MTSTDGSSLGSRLRTARLDAGMSQTDLSTRSGIPKPTLSRYENDHVSPSIHTLHRLAESLRVSEGALLGVHESIDEAFIEALHKLGVSFSSVAEAQSEAARIAPMLGNTRQPRAAG
jgi:transcriptional regulator with XRE-family HTH domain